MIFQYTFGQVLANQKTQTRRAINPTEFAIRGLNNKIMAVATGDRVKWCIGQTYSVQPGRGKSGVARIRLIAINSEKLGRISSADARREGFKDRQDFLKTWKQIHGIVDMDLRVWILKFELVPYSITEVNSIYVNQGSHSIGARMS